MRICLIEQLHWPSTWFWDKIVLNAFFLFQLFQITNNFDLLVPFQFEFCWMVTSAPFSIISNCAQFWWQEEVVTELLFQLFQFELNWAAWWMSPCFNYCVTRAPLLYFIRSWVALSFKVVCQWGIGNTCPDLHFVQYIKAWMSSTDPVSSVTNCYCLIVSYTDPVHSFIIS